MAWVAAPALPRSLSACHLGHTQASQHPHQDPAFSLSEALLRTQPPPGMDFCLQGPYQPISQASEAAPPLHLP